MCRSSSPATRWLPAGAWVWRRGDGWALCGEFGGDGVVYRLLAPDGGQMATIRRTRTGWQDERDAVRPGAPGYATPRVAADEVVRRCADAPVWSGS